MKKLIIEIPDHIYEHAKNCSEDSYDEWDAMRAIAKGQEERPHGKWVREGRRYRYLSRCTNCNMVCGRDYDFYPNCGSDNRPRENNSSSMIINGKYSENVEYGTRVEIRKKRR